jgi:CRP-like cAMP-binding protein
MQDVLRIIQIKSFHLHEIIYKEQSESDSVYFIEKGAVELSCLYKEDSKSKSMKNNY